MSHSIRNEFAWALVVVAACAVIALTVSTQMAFFVLLFAALAWWTWQNQESAFLCLIFFAPLLPMLKITQTLGTFTLSKDVIILTLFAKVFAWPLLQQRLPYRRWVAFLPLLALAVWTAFQLVQADALVVGILRTRDIALYALLYVVALYLPADWATLRRRALWFLTAAAIIILAGCYQWFFAADSAVLRFDPVRSIWIPRMSSTLAHPTVFGEYLTLAAALLAALVCVSKSSRVRLYASIGSLTIVPFIYLTFSRGVWLGYVATLGMIGLLAVWQRWGSGISRKQIASLGISMIVGMVIAGVLLFQFTPVGIFIRSAFDPTYASNQIRLEFLSRLVATTTNWQAIVGHGLGDISQRVVQVIDVPASAFDIASGASREVQLTKDSTLVDNQYLKTFVEMGLVGLLIYAWLYWCLGKHAWYQAIHAVNQEQRIIAYMTVGFLAGFIIQAFFVDIWDVFPTNAYFWIVAGLLAAQASRQNIVDTNKDLL